MEHNFDVVVVGSGAGALLAAVRAADAGLSALVVEKAGLIGGTSATSGGGIWIPNNHDMARAGLSDSLEAAFTYVKTCARGMASDDRILAYLETAPRMARYLEQIGVRYRSVPKYSDYYPTLPGAMPGGRTMDPADFDAAKIGVEALSELRNNNPGQLILGRMTMNAFEAHTLLSRERLAKPKLIWLMLRYALDYPWRSKTTRDRRMTGGQALVGGLFAALRERQVPYWLNSPMRSLRIENGRVTGIVVEREGKEVVVGARKGVVLAAGGFERNQQMREQYLPLPTDHTWTATPPECNTGDTIRAGAAAGASLHLMGHTWGAPTLRVPGEDRNRALFVERSLPGCMVVNARGERFLNESCPYPEFQQAMFADHARIGGEIGAWIVFDAGFRRKYPLGPLGPGEAQPDHRLKKSWLGSVYFKDDTLEGLARQIGVDPGGMAASAARMTEYARSGRDRDFGRGSDVFDRYYSDPSVKPNPNLAPIDTGPFYAIRLYPGEIGTKGGLLTDRDGCVLGETGQPIPGLYCTGNNSASVMGPAYPGAGATLGPAMTFSYRAVAHMQGQPIPLERVDLLEQETAGAARSSREQALAAGQ